MSCWSRCRSRRRRRQRWAGWGWGSSGSVLCGRGVPLRSRRRHRAAPDNRLLPPAPLLAGHHPAAAWRARRRLVKAGVAGRQANAGGAQRRQRRPMCSPPSVPVSIRACNTFESLHTGFWAQLSSLQGLQHLPWLVGPPWCSSSSQRPRVQSREKKASPAIALRPASHPSCGPLTRLPCLLLCSGAAELMGPFGATGALALQRHRI